MQSQPVIQDVAQYCAQSGPGACCMEAQADGVPCTEIRDCEKCGRAVRPRADQLVPPASP